MRHEFSARVKTDAAIRANGRCEECSRWLRVGDFHYDHINPDANGGEATLENCQVLCRSCHKVKTPQDITRISKAKRNYRTAHGIKKQSSFPCARTSRFKKKLNGQVVER